MVEIDGSGNGFELSFDQESINYDSTRYIGYWCLGNRSGLGYSIDQNNNKYIG